MRKLTSAVYATHKWHFVTATLMYQYGWWRHYGKKVGQGRLQGVNASSHRTPRFFSEHEPLSGEAILPAASGLSYTFCSQVLSGSPTLAQVECVGSKNVRRDLFLNAFSLINSIWRKLFSCCSQYFFGTFNIEKYLVPNSVSFCFTTKGSNLAFPKVYFTEYLWDALTYFAHKKDSVVK